MKTKHKVGDLVTISEDALQNYGDEYKDRILTVSHVATASMPAKQFYAAGCPTGFHPGYDEGVSPMALYDFDELAFSLYDWEVD